MGRPTPAQVAHIEQHLDRFHAHAGDDRTPEEYLNEYSHYDDIYERLCHDLGIEPIEEEGMEAPAGLDIQAYIQTEIAKAAAALQGPPVLGVQAPPQSFEDALGQVDPTDSEAALAMLDFLLKTGRLGRVGVLDGGQGYLFMYQEPKGSTKQGYVPGATQGDRIVDEAVEAQRAAGNAPAKRGMCPHCYSVVKVIVDGGREVIMLDDETGTKGDGDICTNSPDGKHGMA